MEIWYDNSVTWLMTNVTVEWGDLPASVQSAYIKSGYSKEWVIETIHYLQLPIEPAEYVFEVKLGEKTIQLFFTDKGQELRVKDVTNEDNTIYPPKN